MNFKKIFLLITLLVFIFNSFIYPQIKPVDKTIVSNDSALSKKIKNMIRYKNGIPEHCTDYDKNGNEITRIYYNDSGLVERIYNDFFKENILYKSIITQNKLKKENYRGGQKFGIEKYTYTYDTSGLTVTRYMYDSLMNLHSKSVTTTDSVNKIYIFEVFDESGRLLIKDEKKYNGDNKISEGIHENTVFSAYVLFKYVYDDEGNNIERDDYSRDGRITSTELFIYSLGKKTESQFYPYENKDKRYVDLIKYNEYGNDVEKISIDTDGNILETNYKKYDKYNNITVEVDSGYENEKPYVYTFKYEYY